MEMEMEMEMERGGKVAEEGSLCGFGVHLQRRERGKAMNCNRVKEEWMADKGDRMERGGGRREEGKV